MGHDPPYHSPTLIFARPDSRGDGSPKPQRLPDAPHPGAAVSGGTEDPLVVSLLEDALRRLGAHDSPLRARVLGRLAMELYWSVSQERRDFLTYRVVMHSRRHYPNRASMKVLKILHIPNLQTMPFHEQGERVDTEIG